jgi:hypothetical protein
MLRLAIQHREATTGSQAAQFSEQPRLADPWITGHLNDLR